MAVSETLAPEKPSSTAPERAEPANPTVRVGNMVKQFLDKGTLHLPADYSPENALKSAWLYLQTVEDMNKRKALVACTQESIVNTLLSMVVQGLNVDKKQCYFIVYGDQLTFQRSYFGDKAVAERVRPGIEIYEQVVYQGDEFEYEIVKGRKVIVKHKTSIENQDVKKIKAAYCGVVDVETGEDLGAEIMTMEQILRSWGQSKTYKPEGNSFHHKFPDQACLRTVVRRRCKTIFNRSSDALLMQYVRQSDDDAALAEFNEEVATKANGETLALPPASETVAIPPVAAPVAEPVPVPAEPAQDTPPY